VAQLEIPRPAVMCNEESNKLEKTRHDSSNRYQLQSVSNHCLHVFLLTVVVKAVVAVVVLVVVEIVIVVVVVE